MTVKDIYFVAALTLLVYGVGRGFVVMSKVSSKKITRKEGYRIFLGCLCFIGGGLNLVAMGESSFLDYADIAFVNVIIFIHFMSNSLTKRKKV